MGKGFAFAHLSIALRLSMFNNDLAEIGVSIMADVMGIWVVVALLGGAWLIFSG